LRSHAYAHLILPVKVSRIKIRQFRNLQSIEVVPDEILNVLVGDNGQGKTSFVEALYYLSTLKSFRTGKTADLVQKDQNGFLIEADIQVSSNINMTLNVRVEDKSRKLFVNERPTMTSKFATKLRAVVFSPESLSSIKSGPEGRRELIDQAAYQLSERAAQGQRDYSRALRQRNACLKQVKNGELTPDIGEDILGSLESNFLSAGAEVIEERLLFLDKIFPKIDGILEKITGVKDSLKFNYQSSHGPWVERRKDAILDRLRAELNAVERRHAERSSGVTLTGPHRHDVSFLFNGNDSRIFCSQGQQRAVILAFKIAEIVYHSEAFGSYPLLLLDDVLSEFDEHKRRFLIEFLRNNEAQTFLTTTDQTHFLKGSRVFQVEAGHIN
jgi:DNA replication and repair protein RecF